MAKIAQVVANGAVTNCFLVDDAATLSNGAISLPNGETISPGVGETFFIQTGAGIGWAVSGGSLVAPTPAPVTYTKDDLVAYANAYQWRLATSGHNVSIGGTSYLFPTDDVSLSLMTGKAVRLQMSGAPTSVDWQLPSGFVTISAADFLTCAAALADWVQSTFEALRPVLAAISAGTITTEAAVGAASWPTP